MSADGPSRLSRAFDELEGLSHDEREARLNALAQSDATLAGRLRWMFGGTRQDVSFTGPIGAIVDEVLEGPAAALGRNSIVGPYRLLESIGIGGMGRVFRAVRDDTGQEVAVKVLRLPFSTPADHAHFAREQRLLARLNHPGIAQLYDADVLDDGTPWFSMEYVRGGQPITVYSAVVGLDATATVRLFREACGAVRHAHQHGIIHRDLKPSNILVTGDGQVKLLDFGVAKAADDAEVLTRTQADGRRLTPAYAAPEQLAGEAVDVRTDVYGLGRVFYEMLTGSRPYQAQEHSPAELLAAVQNDMPRPPSQVTASRLDAIGRGASRDLDVLCLKALQTDPERRYATVDALIEDLDHYLLGEPLRAHPDSVAYRTGKFLKRHAVLAGLTAAMVIVVAGLTMTYAVQLQRAQRETLAAAARTTLVQRFLRDLITGDEAEVGPSRELRVRTLLERGAASADLLSRDPDLQSELYETLGTMFQELGDLAQADTLLTKGLAIRAGHLPSDDPQVIAARINLSLLRTEQSQLEDAERMSAEALRQAAAALPSSHAVVLKARLALGKALVEKGDYPRAIVLLQEAVDGYRRSDPKGADLALALGELAAAHQYAAHQDEALALNEQALAMDRVAHGDRHPSVAHDLLNLADLANTRGNYERSIDLMQEALGIFKRWYGDDHPETGSALMLLSTPLSALGRLDEAEATLREARAIFERTYAGPHRRIGIINNQIGVLATQRGRHDEAIAALSRALEVYRQLYPGGKSQFVSVGIANLATVYLAKNDLAKAEPLFREAVALSTELVSARHMNTAIAQVKLGRVLVRQRRYLEAMPFIEAAYATISRQAEPSVRWLEMAREDYATAHRALGRPGDPTTTLAGFASQ